MKQVVVAVVASLLHRLIPEGWDEPVRILEVDLDQGKADRRYLARRQPSNSWRVAPLVGILATRSHAHSLVSLHRSKIPATVTMAALGRSFLVAASWSSDGDC